MAAASDPATDPQVSPAIATDPAAGAAILALAEGQRPRLDRLPALRPLAERLGTALAARFTQLAAQEVELTVDAIRQHDLAGYLATADGESAVASFACLPQAGAGMIRIQDRLIRPLLDLALGGRRGIRLAPSAARPLTAIEIRLIERLARHVLDDLQAAFASFAPLEFRFDGLATRRDFVPISTGAAVVLLRLRADVQGNGGEIDVVLPGAAVDALKLAPASPAGTRPGDRGSWATRLFGRVCEVDVELEAVLDERMVDLSLVRDLKVGNTVPLGIRPETAVAVRSGGIGVATAAVACRDDHQLVLSIESRITENGASP